MANKTNFGNLYILMEGVVGINEIAQKEHGKYKSQKTKNKQTKKTP